MTSSNDSYTVPHPLNQWPLQWPLFIYPPPYMSGHGVRGIGWAGKGEWIRVIAVIKWPLPTYQMTFTHSYPMIFIHSSNDLYPLIQWLLPTHSVTFTHSSNLVLAKLASFTHYYLHQRLVIMSTLPTCVNYIVLISGWILSSKLNYSQFTGGHEKLD